MKLRTSARTSKLDSVECMSLLACMLTIHLLLTSVKKQSSQASWRLIFIKQHEHPFFVLILEEQGRGSPYMSLFIKPTNLTLPAWSCRPLHLTVLNMCNILKMSSCQLLQTNVAFPLGADQFILCLITHVCCCCCYVVITTWMWKNA